MQNVSWVSKCVVIMTKLFVDRHSCSLISKAVVNIATEDQSPVSNILSIEHAINNNFNFSRFCDFVHQTMLLFPSVVFPFIICLHLPHHLHLYLRVIFAKFCPFWRDSGMLLNKLYIWINYTSKLIVRGRLWYWLLYFTKIVIWSDYLYSGIRFVPTPLAGLDAGGRGGGSRLAQRLGSEISVLV